MMKFNFEKALLVSALALASTTLIAGNPNDGGDNRYIGAKVGNHGVIGCLEAEGGIGNIVVNTVDSTSTGAGGLAWGSTGMDKRADNVVEGLNNTWKIEEYNPTLKGSSSTRRVHASNAAEACLSLSDDGYHNWYLPSVRELYCIQQNKAAIEKATGTAFQDSDYWSSSQTLNDPTNDAWIVEFTTGYEAGTLKSEEHKVRCVRRYIPNL